MGEYVQSLRQMWPGEAEALELLRAQLAPKSKSSQRKRTAARKRSKTKETRAIYAEVAKRANGRCELPQCSRDFSDAFSAAEMDHFLPRGKYRQSIRTCWLIHALCHDQKHASKPDRGFWLEQFIEHCDHYGYWREAGIARAELEAEALLVASESVGAP